MSNSEIRVADVDQVIDLFTSLKDKINSLKIIEVGSPVFSEDGLLFTSNGDGTYTSDKNQLVIAINIIGISLPEYKFYGQLSQSITTTGTVTYSFEDDKNPENVNCPGYVLTSDYAHKLGISIISLRSGDTISFSHSYSTGGYVGGFSMIFSVTSHLNSFEKIDVEGICSGGSVSPGNYTNTISTKGLYLLFGISLPYTVQYSSLQDTSIYINNTDITTITGANQLKKTIGTDRKFSIASMSLDVGDEVGINIAAGNQQGSILGLIKIGNM